MAIFLMRNLISKLELVKKMTLNGSVIRYINRVLQLSPVCILFILRNWFKRYNTENSW